MKKAIAVVLVALFATTAMAAVDNATRPTIPSAWSYTWDFTNSSTAGWTVVNSGGTATPTASGLFLASNGWGNQAYATYDTLPLGINLNGTTGKFILKMDFVTGTGAGYWQQDIGLSAVRPSDSKGIQIRGQDSSGRESAIDTAWDNTVSGAGNVMAQGQACSFWIDYGYSVPGKFTTYAQYAVGNARGQTAGNWVLNETVAGKAVHPNNDIYSLLRIGSMATTAGYGGAYGSMTVQNVQLFVPEPATALLLGLPLLLVRRRRHV
jgi:hypothetical protein